MPSSSAVSKKSDSGQYAAYAERRANASLQMLAELSTSMSMWIDVGTKEDISLSKTASDWKVFCANRASTTIDTTLHAVVQSLFEATETSKYQDFMRAMWGDLYMDARVIEVIGADPESSAATTALQLQRNNPSIFHKTHKRTSIKWFATTGKSKLSKAQEFHLVEFVGLVYEQGRVHSAYVYQESMAKTADVPLPHQTHTSTNYGRVRIDGLILKFEAIELPNGNEYVLLSMAIQRLPSLFDFGFRNPAEELVFRFAKGFREALRRSNRAAPGVAGLQFVQNSSWVRNQDRQVCPLCGRAFHTIVRRRHHCRACGEVVCFQCSNVFTAASLSADPNTMIQGDTRLCNRCVAQHQADANQQMGVLSADALEMWLDEELAENNPDLFDEPPQPPPRRVVLPSGGAFTGTLEVNAFASSPPSAESMKRRAKSGSTSDAPVTLGSAQDSSSPRASSHSMFAEDSSLSSTGILLGAERRNFEAEPVIVDAPPTFGSSVALGESQSSSTTSSQRTEPQTESNTITITTSAYRANRAAQPSQASVVSKSQRQPREPRHVFNQEVPMPAISASPRTSLSSNSHLNIDPKYLPRQASIPRISITLGQVRSASAWAYVTTSTSAAVAAAMRDLYAKINDVHFLVVSFSEACDAIDVMAALEYEAPGVPYIGGLSARGICDESAWISMKRNGLIAVWGIHDPNGVYSVGTVSYDENNAKDEAYEAICAAQRSMSHHLPAFCLVYACPLVVDEALAGVRQAIDCPVLGGCSVLSTQYQSYFQISSSGGASIGMSFALASPSVECSVGWFSGYEAVCTALQDPTVCCGVVTAADAQAKTVFEINDRPAAEVYREWLGQVFGESELTVGFPRLGYMYPLGQVVQNAPVLQVNATPVVTAVDDGTGAVSTTTPIRKGSQVALMHTSPDKLKDNVKQMAQALQRDQKFALSEVEGCLMFLSAGVQVVLGSSQSMSGLVGAYNLWSGGASFLGLTSFGEIGHLAHDNTPQCDALMFSYLVFSNRRRQSSPPRGHADI
ncbi:unnamed protein product [Aphanomyces euteiches]|uniref:FYVE-type domain-containing protein n=1 Tax=Aphanomyces euteiches TaxID=100861 RepID=A0A6G0WNK7_9STRA|nr:hypothetical protein Ae201684_013471 [Aphanomyces euteiches]KAH9150322.1 hypothetical protein AeRB84_006800 [Aphanomyces euteiches]